MNYITLGIACLLFSLQFIFFKWYQLRTDNSLKAAVWMTVLDGAWMFSIFFIANGLSLHITPTSAMYATFYSFFIVMGNIVALFAIRHGKVAVVSLYMLTGGMVFPVIYGVLMLGETLNLYKEIGLVLIFIRMKTSFLLMLKIK